MIRVRFWGTRGSITAPGQATWYYGGYTACVDLIGFRDSKPQATGHAHLILDGGSGLAALQPSLMAGVCGRGQGELHILISHYHWDHVIGLPFFGPMFVPGNQIVFYGDSVNNLRSTIERLFTSNYSPLKGAQNVAANVTYRQVNLDNEMDIAGFRVQAAEHRHPGKAITYRVQYGTAVVIYSTDHDIGDPAIDGNLLELARGADMWILDGMYTPSQKRQRQNFGHSTHLEAVELALTAGVKTVALFHHAPEHDDAILDQMACEATEFAANTPTQVLMARDRLVLDVG